MTCDCLNNTAKHLCAHTLATAERLNLLENLLQWYKKTINDVSLWELVRSSGAPKNPGNKPTSRKRSRQVQPPVKTASILTKPASS